MNRIPIRRQNAEKLLEISDFEVLKHLHKVLKVSLGDPLKLTLIGEGLSNGIIVDCQKEKVVVEISEITAPAQAKTKLIIGLSRPLTCQKVLEHGTTLGVSEFHFFKAELSEKSFLESKFIQQGKFENYLLKGLSQSGIYSHLPKVTISSKFADIPLEEFNKDNKYILSLSTKEYLSKKTHLEKFATTFLIGPERGFTAEEEEIFLHYDFRPICIGPSIQRVEYATASALAQLELIQSSNIIN